MNLRLWCFFICHNCKSQKIDFLFILIWLNIQFNHLIFITNFKYVFFKMMKLALLLMVIDWCFLPTIT